MGHLTQIDPAIMLQMGRLQMGSLQVDKFLAREILTVASLAN